MPFRDRYGLILSTTSPRAAEAYCRGLDHALAAEAPAEACFREARTEDPGFALAHIAEARMLQFRGCLAEAREAAERARQVASGATPRERQHVECIAAAVAGDARGALERTRAHVTEYPRDAFVLSLATGVYGLIGFSGRLERNEEQLALLEPLADVYGDDWWFLAQFAFALNELGRHREAEQAARASFEGNPRNGHASHTLAHVAYETGDTAGGAAFLAAWLAGDDPANQLYVHNTWHLALFELAAGNLERVLALYEAVIRPGVATSPPLGTLADAASLLWRCSLTELPPAELPWAEVAAYAAAHFPRAGVTWADAHCLLAWCAVHDIARLETLVGQLRDRAAGGRLNAGPMLVTLGEGYLAFARGDWSRAANLLQLARPELIRLGGSRAQRDVFEETLVEACARAGRVEQARAILEERLARRPNGRDGRWLATLAARPAATA